MSEVSQRFEVISIKHLAGVVVLQTLDGDSVQPPLQSGGLVALQPAEDTRLPPAVPALDAVFKESIRARNAAADDAMNADLLRQIASNPDLLEIGRKAIEDALVERRDARLSEPLRGNGLVVRNADGEASSVIRFGPERALTIALRAIAEHLSRSAGAKPSDAPTSSDARPLGQLDAQWWLEQRANIIDALAAKSLRIVSNADGVRLAPTAGAEQPRVVGYLTERGQFYGSLTAMPKHEHEKARPLTFADGAPR